MCVCDVHLLLLLKKRKRKIEQRQCLSSTLPSIEYEKKNGKNRQKNIIRMALVSRRRNIREKKIPKMIVLSDDDDDNDDSHHHGHH